MGAARMLVALFAGALFGLGLAVSGMMDPATVTGFLDFAGDWDPTLMFVMGGALLVSIPAVRLVLRRSRPVLADGFALPTKSAVDARLLGGAGLFGVGWGLSGFCPGPAVAALVPALAAGLVPVFRVPRRHALRLGGLRLVLRAPGTRRYEGETSTWLREPPPVEGAGTRVLRPPPSGRTGGAMSGSFVWRFAGPPRCTR